MNVARTIPEWAVPLLEPSPLKGASGGRASGKSHNAAERLIERHEQNKDFRSVCIREVQRSIRFSSYQLIKDKIQQFGLQERFEVTRDEIRDNLGSGVIVFQGMQDHTADSIKSLEGFDLSWFEEAQRASKRSLELLTPTILRKQNAECWFTWNPDQETDAIEDLAKDPDFLRVHVNYMENPYRTKGVIREAEKLRAKDPDAYNHIWLGQFNTKSESQIFNGHYVIDSFEIGGDWIPLHGLDFGFSQDPTAAVRLYLQENKLFIYQEAGKVGLELDDTLSYIGARIPEIGIYEVQADSARPESISYLKRHGMPNIKGVKKWSGSVEDGIEFMKSLDKIIIHPQCKQVADEFKLYSYKVDKRTDTVLPKIVDAHNHYIDAIRYALTKHIKPQGFVFV